MGEVSAEKAVFASLARKVISNVGRAFSVEPSKVRLEDITDQFVASILVDTRGPQVAKKDEAPKQEELIWIPDLMREEGCLPEITPQKELEAARVKNRAALDNLTRAGALEMAADVPNDLGELLAWREINPAKLEEIAGEPVD